jgi:hypothetical protein
VSTAQQYDDATRAKARALAERLKSDPSFRTQVEADPAGTLTGAGLPDQAVTDFLTDTGIQADVAGYALCTDSCLITCLFTHDGPDIRLP